MAGLQLNAGANVNSLDKFGMTPLLIAAQKGNVLMIKLLVKKGANVNVLDTKDKKTPLYFAIENGHTEAAETLIGLGADVKVADETFKFTPLHLAAQKGNTELLKPLIYAGADVNAKDEKGNTPHSLACKNGKSETARALLKLGAKDFIPLYTIAMDGLAEALRSLKTKESEKNNEDSQGNIPQSAPNLREGEGGKRDKLYGKSSSAKSRK